MISTMVQNARDVGSIPIGGAIGPLFTWLPDIPFGRHVQIVIGTMGMRLLF